MFSKAWIKTGIAFLSLITVVGCSEFLKGKKQEQEVIELSDDKFACLKVVPKNLKKMTLGTATETEISTSFSCVQQSLLYFEKRTQGSYEDGYTPEDLRKFFGKYFLKENNITPEISRELLKFKKALFGGSSEWISKAEVRLLVDFMGPVKNEMLLLSKHMGVLLLKKQPQDLKPTEAADAVEQLRSSLQNLMRNTEIAKSDYSFADGKKLMMGLSNFVTGTEAFEPYTKLAKWMPLVESIKRFLIGERAQLAGLNDWSVALNNFVDLYNIFLRYHYLIQHESTNSKEGLKNFTGFGMQVYELIYGSFQMNKAGEIPFKDIDSLIDQAVVAFKIPFSLNAVTLKETYRVAVLRILEPYRNGDTRGLGALTRTHMLSLKREVNVWRLTQAFIDKLSFAGQKNMISQVSLLESYAQFNTQEIIREGIDRDPLEQEALRRSWVDFGVLLKSNNPVVFGETGRYLVSNRQKMLPHTWKTLTRFNVIKAFQRTVMIGYADKNPSDLVNAAISEASFVKAYDDFRLLGVAIKAFDPRNANTGARNLKEANYFTFSGNGDALMDFKESFEFFSIMTSAGLGTSTDIAKDMEKLNCTSAKIDIFGFKMLKEACFASELHKNFRTYFDNLFVMGSYVSGLSEAQWGEFIGTLLRATRISDPRGGLLETSDLRSLVVVLHYTEDLMVTYDQDGNRTLSLDEIYSSAPRFMSFLRQTNPGTSDGNLRDGLAYMLIYGKKPSILDMIGFKASIIFRDPPEANHLNILKVIEVLKDDLK